MSKNTFISCSALIVAFALSSGCKPPSTDDSNQGGNSSGGSSGDQGAGGMTGATGASGPSGSLPTCTTSQVLCGATCIDPLVNTTFCGATGDCAGANDGTTCAGSETCTSGQCVCPSGNVRCDGTCVDPALSLAHCGASLDCTGTNSGDVCTNGETCMGGTCACPASTMLCGGSCVDPTSDETYCGANCPSSNLGTMCNVGAGESCNAGACGCPSGGLICDGMCTNPQTSDTHCGASGACSATPGINCIITLPGSSCQTGSCACPMGFVVRGGECINPLTNNAYCGAHDQASPSDGVDCTSIVGSSCVMGTCDCAPGQVERGSECIDPLSDNGFCGAAGVSGAPGSVTGTDCASIMGSSCLMGACECPIMQLARGSECIDPLTSDEYCGAVGISGAMGSSDGANCVTSNIGSACMGGLCTCPSNEVSCNTAAPGVRTCANPQTDARYCGASLSDCQGTPGTACNIGAGEICEAGLCGCPSGEIVCGALCINPNTSHDYCGASGDCLAANAGTVCQSNGGACGPTGSMGAVACSCPAQLSDCSNNCVDQQTDPTNCGGCNTDCAFCDAGTCIPKLVTFDFTGGMQTYTAPTGITRLRITLFGAEGGVGANGGNGAVGGSGGLGAQIVADLAVSPGDTFNVFVGGKGNSPTAGFNGGGTGGSQNAGGGGGATDIRFGGTSEAERILIAGGGGGGGRAGCEGAPASGGAGGGGGGGPGSNGVDAATSGGVAGGGAGGIAANSGAAGVGCGGFLGTPGSNATTATGGNGGNGQACCCFSFGSIPGGGGGGGGLVGGGGGGGGSAGTAGCSGNDKGGGGGGAGGSSFAVQSSPTIYPRAFTGVSETVGVRLGNGHVIIEQFIPQ